MAGDFTDQMEKIEERYKKLGENIYLRKSILQADGQYAFPNYAGKTRKPIKGNMVYIFGFKSPPEN